MSHQPWYSPILLFSQGGKMRVADVRKRYPEFFATVQDAVLTDSIGIIFDKPAIRRIAYNAAAVATLELHKYFMKWKNPDPSKMNPKWFIPGSVEKKKRKS
jgi:hypothetical protein